MKKIVTILIIIIIVSTITGCLYDGKHMELYQMTRVNVIGTNGVGETDKVNIEIIEEDEQGRILFSYTMNVIRKYYGYDSICIIAICQKSDWNLTYYYEDECFIISDTYNSISEEDIDELKSNNDWNKPINEEKLSSRPIYPDYSDYNGLIVRDIFSREIGIEDGAEISCGFTDYDGVDKLFYYVVLFDANNDDIVVTQRFYLMIINEDGSYNEDTFIVEIEDLYNYQNLLHEFKIDNGWSFS